MLVELVSNTRVLEIVGDMIRVEAQGVALGELAAVQNVDGTTSTARVTSIDGRIASLQVFSGGKGLSNNARISFLGRPFQVTFSNNILGRIFRGSGEPIDGKPELSRCAGLAHDRDRSADDRFVQLPGRESEDSYFFGGR
jgi:V/A-type H+-transporting ATPase subunit B